MKHSQITLLLPTCSIRCSRTTHLLLEPGRSIVGDAGILLSRILYVKRQAGHTFYIVDASMSELIRPALYQAHHEIVPVLRSSDADAVVRDGGWAGM